MVLASRDFEVAPETTLDIDYRIAATRQEREAAFHLVYKSYLRARLGGMNRYEMRVTPYHLLPTTEVFIAQYQDDVIFTISLVGDGELGLPMELVYGEEAALRRRLGLRMAEVSCLADRRTQFRGFFPVFIRLCRVMVQTARMRGYDELVVAVHPKHARFYRRFMAFEVFGQQQAYPTVRNHPAVAMSLNFARIDRELPSSYDTFFGESLPEEMLRPCPIGAADCDYFRAMIDPSFKLAPLGEEEFPARNFAEAAGVA